jgi:peptidoglycan hydrolase-like protein with peptidoglycan-binding domain
MSISAAFAVLTENSDDVRELMGQLGGITGTIKAMPAILRIAQTYSERSEPDQNDRVVKVLYYNKETRQRVAEFQRSHGLDADGIVGNATWDKVEQLIK